MAGNQLGKTLAGGFECAMHLTGRYPAWWAGRRFDRAVRFWVANVTGESTRDNVQRILLGTPAMREAWGTGTIPARTIEKVNLSRNIANAVDSVVVRHRSGGLSMLKFKAYALGREKWPTASCVTGDECAWAKRIVVAESDQLTRATKVQIISHNRKVRQLCR